MLCFFFPTLYPNIPEKSEIRKFERPNAAYVMKCFDTYLLSCRWPIVGYQDDWECKVWDAPKFYSPYKLHGTPWLISYDQIDLSRQIAMEPCTTDYENLAPRDFTAGARAAEIQLTIRFLGREFVRADREGSYNEALELEKRQKKRALKQAARESKKTTRH